MLDLGTTEGAIVADIFEKNDNYTQNRIPWDMFVVFSVNMGKINSIKSRVLVKNPDLYFVGCSNHMAHNTARKEEIAFLDLLDLMLRI